MPRPRNEPLLFNDEDLPRSKPSGEPKARFVFKEGMGEKWSNAKAATIAYHIALGKSASEIADIIGDGTTPATIRSLRQKWGLPSADIHSATMSIEIHPTTAAKLRKMEKRLKKPGKEIMERILVYAIGGDLYEAIVDGER